jgi:preprotein translocase subunit Sec61beta
VFFDLVLPLLCLGLLLLGIILAIIQSMHFRAARQLIDQLETSEHPLFGVYADGKKFDITQINGGRTPRLLYVVVVKPGQIGFYTIPRDPKRDFTLTPDELRWFGRPEKYHPGANEIWLHVERDGGWLVVKARLSQYKMRGLVRAMKEIMPPDLITAYRRQRPYIHYGPVRAQSAAQDMLGAWTLGDPVSLYLMPRFLVKLVGPTVCSLIPLETVQQVSAIQRLDQPGAAGLIRFVVSEEIHAYALDQHESFAAALAEAAKRTLEDPVLWQRKKKKPDEFDDEEEDDFA